MSMFDDVAPSFINRSKATSVRLQGGGIYIGIVTRIAGTSLDRIYVKVPKLGGVNEYGPCVVAGVIPSVGDFVLVGFLDNKMSEIVSFGTFSQHPPTYDSLLSILEQYAPKAYPTFTGTVTLPSQTYIGTVSATEIGYIDGLTSNAQTQLESKAPKNGPVFTGSVSLPSATSIGTVSATEISYVDGVTSSIQTQINDKQTQIDTKLNKTRTIINNSSATLTLDATHISAIIECSSGSATTVTIPTDTTYNFPIGTEINISWVGTASTVRVARASTAITANGSTSTTSYFYLRTQWSTVTLFKRASNSWHVFGDFYIA